MPPAARSVLRALLFGIAVSVAVTGLSRVGVLAGWETRAVDAFLFLRDPVRAPGIVVVALDEDAFRSVGERQPISRRYLADLCDVLLRSGARVVGLDITLKVPAAEDEALVAVAQRWNRGERRPLVFAAVATPVHAAAYALDPLFSSNLPGLVGFSNGLIGSDGIIRRMAPTLPADGDRSLPALSLAVLASPGCPWPGWPPWRATTTSRWRRRSPARAARSACRCATGTASSARPSRSMCGRCASPHGGSTSRDRRAP